MSKKHTHSLTPGLVETLRKMAVKVKATEKNKVHPRKDLDLTISEYNNFQKLQYWGLAIKEGEKGYWMLTRTATEFLSNERTVPKKVTTLNSKKIEESDKKVDITDYFSPIEKYWQEDFGSIPVEQKQLF